VTGFGAFVFGDEILVGKRQDKHFPWLIEALSRRGLRLAWCEHLGDEPERVTQALKRSFAADDIVFCFGGSGVSVTSTCVSAKGWQSGTRSAVRLAAMMPARRATVSTSPFGRSPFAIRANVPALMRTRPRATASRSVTALRETSTMRARPDASTCESRFAFGGTARSLSQPGAPLNRRGATVRARPPRVPHPNPAAMVPRPWRLPSIIVFSSSAPAPRGSRPRCTRRAPIWRRP
jgi:hypothetical protein